MVQLHRDYAQLVQRACEVVVVGPEDAAAFKRYWEKEKLPFVGLPDPTHTVLKRYGQEVRLFKLGRLPAQMLVDKAGILRFVHYGHSMSDIPPTREIVDSLVA